MFGKMIKNTLAVATLIALYSNIANASKLDPYKDLIRNKEFTVGYTYETEIPTLFNDNPDATHVARKVYQENYSKAVKYYKNKLYIPNMTQLAPEDAIKNGNSVMYFMQGINSQGTWLRNLSLPAGGKGIAVINKNNIYSECVTKLQSIHHLKLGDNYIGWKSYCLKENDSPKYSSIGETMLNSTGINAATSIGGPIGGLFNFFGGGDNSLNLKYSQYDVESELNYGVNLGSTLITRYINAILPDEEHAVYVPSFKLVAETPEYEDYQTYEDGKKEVVRYCFEGDNLKQIMAVVARYKIDGTPIVHQYKIIINQFDNKIDTKYFEIPAYIKIKK